MRSIKEEEVDLSDCMGCTDAAHQLGRFLDEVCAHKRIHSSLGYLTPAEFEDQWQREQAQVQDVHQKPPKRSPISGVHLSFSLSWASPQDAEIPFVSTK